MVQPSPVANISRQSEREVFTKTFLIPNPALYPNFPVHRRFNHLQVGFISRFIFPLKQKLKRPCLRLAKRVRWPVKAPEHVVCQDEHFGAFLGGSYDFVLSLATTLKGKSQTRLVLSMDYVFEFSDIHSNIYL